MLDELKSIPAGAFEAIDASPLMVSPNSGQARVVTSSPPGGPGPGSGRGRAQARRQPVRRGDAGTDHDVDLGAA